MNIKRIVIALILLALAVGAFLGYRTYFEEKEYKTYVESRSFKKEGDRGIGGVILPRDVVEIKFKSPNGNITVERKEGDVWYITDPYYIKTSQDFVPQMPFRLTTLTEDDLIEQNPADLAKYGLDNPKVVVKFKTRFNEWHEIQFGNRTPTDSLYYTYNPQSKNVFTTDYTMMQDFNGNVYDYMDKKLMVNNPRQCDKVIVELEGKTYEFSKDLKIKYWFQDKPVAGKVFQNGFTSFLVFMKSAEGNFLIPAKEVDEDPGFDKPYAKMTFIKTGEWTETIIFGSTLRGDFRYAKRGDSENPLLVNADRFAEQFDQLKNIMSILAIWFPKNGIKRLQITNAENSFVLTRASKTTPWHLEGDPSSNLDDGVVQNALFKLQEAKNEGYIGAAMPEAGPQYGLDKPVVTVSMEFINPQFQPLTLFYGSKDPSGKYIYTYNTQDPNILKIDAALVDLIPKSAKSLILK